MLLTVMFNVSFESVLGELFDFQPMLKWWLIPFHLVPWIFFNVPKSLDMYLNVFVVLITLKSTKENVLSYFKQHDISLGL